VHRDPAYRRVRTILLRVERDPKIGGAEPVWPDVDEEVRAVRSGQDDVRPDERP